MQMMLVCATDDLEEDEAPDDEADLNLDLDSFNSGTTYKIMSDKKKRCLLPDVTAS